MEKFDLENFPTSESAKRMMEYVSEGFYDKSYVGKWLYQVMGLEYDAALAIIKELPAQMFPETATWGLVYHEIKWGLPVRQNLPVEERRKLICQKRDSQAAMTPYRMEQYLESMLGLEVHVSDINDPGKFSPGFEHPNIFRVTIIGDSALDLGNVRTTLDRLKQSHTAYEIELMENRYEVAHCTYTAIAAQTKKTYVVEVL